jgi:hypothetical protein
MRNTLEIALARLAAAVAALRNFGPARPAMLPEENSGARQIYAHETPVGPALSLIHPARPAPRARRVKALIDLVLWETGVSRRLFFSPTRREAAVRARELAAHLMRERLDMSLHEIGEALHRTHGAALAMLRRVATARRIYPKAARTVARLEELSATI